MLDEVKHEVEVTTTGYKRRAEQCLNRRVCPRSVKVEDFVLKQIGITTQDERKLSPQWEGLYIVVAKNYPSTYWLQDTQGNELPHL